MAPEAVTENELHAYVDGQLPVDRLAAVEAHLATNPDAAAEVADYRTEKALLHTLYDPILDEPMPERLHIGRKKLIAPWPRRVAAGLLIIVLGGIAGWWSRGLYDETSFRAGSNLAQWAINAHAVFTPEVRHPVEVAAEEEAHLVKWLSKRLKAPLKAPKLSGHGYGLVGGRLLSGASGPAALFMYESDQGRRLTLYVKRRAEGAHETAFRYVHDQGIGVFYWIDDALSYAIAGEMAKADLLAVSRVIYEQLDE